MDFIKNWNNKERCPMCNRKLMKKKGILICKNWKCPLYWKLKTGWVYYEYDKKKIQ